MPRRACDDLVLRIVLAGVDDVVDGVGVAEDGVAGSRWVSVEIQQVWDRVFVELFVAEVLAGEEAELPEVVGDVLADVGDGAVGADDDLGVFIGARRVHLLDSLFVDGFGGCVAPGGARRMTQQPLFLPSVSR